MKCLKCSNRKNFIFFFNQNIKTTISKGKLKIQKEELILPDIYPVICERCDSEEIDFNYRETEKIRKKLSSSTKICR